MTFIIGFEIIKEGVVVAVLWQFILLKIVMVFKEGVIIEILFSFFDKMTNNDTKISKVSIG
jgi:hypothetical protein